MTLTTEKLHFWMTNAENENLEFKEAKNDFNVERLTKYCSAFANEGGGYLILGVSDKLPRKIVGTSAFQSLSKIKSDLITRLHIRIGVDEIFVENRRVLVVSIPSRPIGMPIQYNGVYWMRRGEELVPMLPDMLKRIFEEGEPDFSAKICPGITLKDMDLEALRHFRELWARKSGKTSLISISDEKLLRDIEVVIDKGFTYAALILFGTHDALGKYLAQAEVIFEYRSGTAVGPAQQRIEYRQGFFSFYNDIWEKINLRNDVQHFQDGLFIWDIPTFNEEVIREAILNAISHRDYRAAGSIWVRQNPRTITIASPGGFPPGITPENMLWKQQPRNRRIAEVLAKCGLVERAGQGADRIFEESIKQGKSLPDFSCSDAYEVVLTIDGEIRDRNFLRFLEKIGKERLASFNTEDFLILDLIHKDLPIPKFYPNLKNRLNHLLNLGVIEGLGKGRRAQYMLSRQYYSMVGQSGVYTRKRGLDKETNKALLLKHIRSKSKAGAKFRELHQVLPSLSDNQVKQLLKELKVEELIHIQGKTSAGCWFPTPNT